MRPTCRKCGCYLAYNHSPLCRPCTPYGAGALLEVRPGVWVRERPLPEPEPTVQELMRNEP